jgi:predicted acetyltransferase
MAYSILQCDIRKCKEDIISLWRRNFQGVLEQRYSWIYENNPAGSAICYLLKDDERNKIVGAVTLIPRKIILNGKPINASIIADLSIDKDIRSQGYGFSLIKSLDTICDGKRFSMLYAFPYEASGPIFRKAEYEILSEIHEMTKILRSHYYIKKNIDYPILTRILSSIVDFIIHYNPKTIFKKHLREYSLEKLTYFDKRFDDLWEKVSTQFTLIGERSCSFLNWRFKEAPDKYNIFALTSNSGSHILGYVISTASQTRVHIADIVFLNDSILNALLLLYFRHQRAKGVDAVTITIAANPLLINKFKYNGFSVRSKIGRVVINMSSKINFTSQEIKKKKWYLMTVDNDV